MTDQRPDIDPEDDDFAPSRAVVADIDEALAQGDGARLDALLSPLHAADIAPAHDVPTVDARVLQALRAGDAGLLAEALQNDLQAPALRLMPRLAGTLEL